ncbi:thiolase family protein [Viridibacillus sp. NPDC093762]|uniref:thiolase family protein n=1 Tax=Viridibacillus sp. NPDC093762 TaxID=3390720 RepID=UPI003D04A4A7
MIVKDVYIVAAKRTAIGSFGKTLKDYSAVDLGEFVVNALFEDVPFLKEEVDEIYMGNVLKSGLKGNPARQIGILTGLPISVSAMTIDMQCASGLTAIIQGVNRIQCGESEVIVAGGIESMTNVPHLMLESRWGTRLGNPPVVDALLHDGLVCAIEGYHMGITAENLVEKYGISREAQDAYALKSQQKALKAIEENRFAEEIVPIPIYGKENEPFFNMDEHPRATTLKHLENLAPAFKKDGTVTPGNTSGLNDGAAAVLIVSEGALQRLGLQPLAKIVSTATCGVQPSIMGIGPVPAILKAVDRAEMKLEDIDLFEINEAFAAQVIAVNTELNIPEEKLNVNGGAIALGHPVGASGARIIVTLLHELKRRGLKTGVGSLCVGGGLGAATIIEIV